MNTQSLPPETDSPPDVTIGFDLARHRSLCVVNVEGERRDVPLTPTHRGLILRWVDTAETKHRVTDRITRLAGVQQAEAVEIASAVAECVFPEPLPAPPFVSIPSAFGPACRTAIVDGFRRQGIAIDRDHLIERPLATFAAWIQHRNELRCPDPVGPMLVLDNDGGQISACAIDTDARRILFTAPLSSGPDDAMGAIIDRLHCVVRELDRLRSGHDLVRSNEWSAVAASVTQIAVSGSMSEHPLFLDLLNRVLPAAAVLRDPVLTDPADIVSFGLTSLDALASWSAGWPTLNIMIDDQLAVSAGPLETGSVDGTVTVAAGSTLSLVDDQGRRVSLAVGQMEADGIQLPNDIGGEVTVRVLADGRVLLLGASGVRPLSFSVQWPIGQTAAGAPVEVSPVGRRPLALVTPRAGRSRRTTAA